MDLENKMDEVVEDNETNIEITLEDAGGDGEISTVNTTESKESIEDEDDGKEVKDVEEREGVESPVENVPDIPVENGLEKMETVKDATMGSEKTNDGKLGFDTPGISGEDNTLLTPPPQEPVDQLEKAEVDAGTCNELKEPSIITKEQKLNITKTPENLTGSPKSFGIGYFERLCGRLGCCSALLLLLKTNKPGKTPMKEDSVLGRAQLPDGKVLEIFGKVEGSIKDAYVESVGGEAGGLLLTVHSYKFFENTHGSNYIIKIKINKSQKFIHAQILKEDKADPILVGEVQVGKTEEDELESLTGQ